MHVRPKARTHGLVCIFLHQCRVARVNHFFLPRITRVSRKHQGERQRCGVGGIGSGEGVSEREMEWLDYGRWE